MPNTPLYFVPTSRHFSPGSIVYASIPELTPIPHASPGHSYTSLHGTCDYRNGEDSLFGAWDDSATERMIKLPAHLQTGDDRKPNPFGWCVGDIGILKVFESATLPEGTLVQLTTDDGSRVPHWTKAGTESCRRFINYNHIDKIELPTHLVGAPQAPESTSVVLRPGVFMATEGVTDHKLGLFAQLLMAAGAETGEWGDMTPHVWNYMGWKAETGIYFQDRTEFFGPARDLVELSYADIEPLVAAKLREGFCPGDLVKVRDFHEPEQLAIVARAMIASGAPAGEWNVITPSAWRFMGWHPTEGVFFSDESDNYADSGSYRMLTPSQALAMATGMPSTKPTTTLTPPEGESPMFANNTKVVANGFRYSMTPAGEHRFGTTSAMTRWTRDKTVLTVRSCSPSGNKSVSVTDGKDTYNFHVSELRLATPEEIAELPPAAPAPAVPKRGAIIKVDDKIYMVASNRVDGDNDLRIRSVHNEGTRSYLRMGRDTFTVLGQIMEDGDFRPAEAPATTPRLVQGLPVGAQVRCIKTAPYLTVGNVYTLTQPVKTTDTRVSVTDNDGDRGRYDIDTFEVA